MAGKTPRSSALIGSAVGAWFGGLLSDRIGRIRTMQLAAVLFLISAIGIASLIGPAYIAEVAPPTYRGRLASLQQLAIVLGIGVSALVNWGIKAAAPLKADGSRSSTSCSRRSFPSRRTTCSPSAIGLGVAAIAFGHAQTVNGELSLPGTWGPVALIFANLFVLSFALSWGVILWVLLGEMFPLRIRGAALAVGTAANWVVTVSFPSMGSWNLSVTYSIYAAFAVRSRTSSELGKKIWPSGGVWVKADTATGGRWMTEAET